MRLSRRTNEATGAKFTTISSSAGLYSFPNLLIGSYTVSVEYSGFKKHVRKNVVVAANQVVESDATLEVGAVESVIQITGGAEMVSTTSSQVASTLEAKAVTDLPNSVLGGRPAEPGQSFSRIQRPREAVSWERADRLEAIGRATTILRLMG